MPDDKQMMDKENEAAKDSSDAFMQDYLQNLRRGLEGYATSVNNYMDDFSESMERHKNLVLKTVDEQVAAINKRMNDLGIVTKKVEGNVAAATTKREDPPATTQPPANKQLKAVIQQLRIILAEIEKTL